VKDQSSKKTLIRQLYKGVVKKRENKKGEFKKDIESAQSKVDVKISPSISTTTDHLLISQPWQFGGG
jgi:hypothetical protein